MKGSERQCTHEEGDGVGRGGRISEVSIDGMWFEHV